MKLILLYTIFILLFSISAKAQINLVPNYSFEEMDSCPVFPGGVDHYPRNWFTPISMMNIIPAFPFSDNGAGSSDYYNICSLNQNQSVPKNYIGYQLPKTGDAYVVFFQILDQGNNINYKEYIEIKLKENLKSNSEYCIEFYYSNSGYFPVSDYFSIDIGVLITDTLVYRSSGINTQQPQNILANPQIRQQLPTIRDTVNWIKISGIFIAQGGERYITIGNFQDTDTLIGKKIYTYIDNVKLYQCDTDTIIHVDSMIVPNVFTPNNDGINDKFEFKNQQQWEYETQIFNRWGHLIYDNSKSGNWDGFYKSEKVTSGVYYYVIQATAIKTGEVVVYRGTVSVLY